MGITLSKVFYSRLRRETHSISSSEIHEQNKSAVDGKRVRVAKKAAKYNDIVDLTEINLDSKKTHVDNYCTNIQIEKSTSIDNKSNIARENAILGLGSWVTRQSDSIGNHSSPRAIPSQETSRSIFSSLSSMRARVASDSIRVISGSAESIALLQENQEHEISKEGTDTVDSRPKMPSKWKKGDLIGQGSFGNVFMALSDKGGTS